MGSCHQIQLLHLVFFLLISDAVVGHQSGNGRSLLQIKKPCPVNIENQNYTVLTRKCKGPDYPSEPCCSGFKELACPIVDQLDDLSNDCSDKLFSYITTVGQYPPGLFASICREGKDGLYCPDPPPSPTPNTATRLQFFLALLLFPLHFVLSLS